MTTMVLPRPTAAEPGGLRSLRLAVVFTLAAWFAVVVIFGAMGAFVAPPGKPPLPAGPPVEFRAVAQARGRITTTFIQASASPAGSEIKLPVATASAPHSENPADGIQLYGHARIL